jgi:uncharacterized membrane protein YvbJ
LEPKSQIQDAGQTLKQLSSNVLPFFRRNKKMSIVLIIIIGLISLIYIAGAFLSDPIDKVIAFEQAVRNGDIKQLRNLVHSPESNVEVTDKQLQDLVKYSRENKHYLPEIINNMMAQLNDEKIGIPSTSTSDYYLKATKIPLFYTQYMIEFRPYFIEISTNEAGAILKVDNKKVFTTTEAQKEFTYGPVMPGNYKVSAEKQAPFALLKEEQQYSIFERLSSTADIDLSLTGGTLVLESNFDETAIFVNGKSIGKTIKEMSEISPISFNSTIRVHGEQQFPWGKEKSPEILIEESTTSADITPKPFAEEATRKPIVDLINQFVKEELQALIKHNANLLTTVDDNLKAEYVNEINDDVKFNYTWKGKAHGTRIDFDHVSLSKDEDTGIYQVTIPVEIHASYKEYSSFENTNSPTEEKTEPYHFTLSYNEKRKKWLISKTKKQYFNSESEFTGNNTVKSEFK